MAHTLALIIKDALTRLAVRGSGLRGCLLLRLVLLCLYLASCCFSGRVFMSIFARSGRFTFPLVVAASLRTVGELLM